MLPLLEPAVAPPRPYTSPGGLMFRRLAIPADTALIHGWFQQEHPKFWGLQGASVAGATSPEAYLAELTGSPDRVKIVSNAEDLGASITTFELPAAKTNTASASATITGTGDARRIPLKSVKEDPKDPSKIVVTTKRFKLTEDGKDPTSRYTIKLKVGANDGSVQETTVVINLKAQ